MLKDSLDQLIQMATRDRFSSEIYEARKEYQKITGEIYEDDKSYENRMALFLEWFVFDRIDTETDRTLLESIIHKDRETWAPDLLRIHEGFTSNIFGIFIVKKIRDHSVTVLNLFDKEKYEVVEPEGKLLFDKSDLFEGRLMFYDNSYQFTGSFCFHPQKAGKFIRQQIDQINSNQNGYKKELKIINSQLNDENKSLYKTNSKIEKFKNKLQKSSSEAKTSKMTVELAELETQRSDLEGKVSRIENKIKTFIHEKFIREGRAAQTLLSQKLSYMHLIWERSRQIALDDIYRN